MSRVTRAESNTAQAAQEPQAGPDAVIRAYFPTAASEAVDCSLHVLKSEMLRQGAVYKFEGGAERQQVDTDEEGQEVNKILWSWLLRDRNGVLWSLSESVSLMRIRVQKQIRPFDYVFLQNEGESKGGKFGHYLQWTVKVIPADKVPANERF